MRLNQSFQVVAVLRRAEILFEGKIYRTSKVMMNFQKRKEHGLCDKQVNSLSSLDLQKTQLSSKLHLVSISIPTLTGIFFLPFFSLILVNFQPWLKKFRIIVLSPTQITQMSVYEISLTEKDEPMLMTMRFCIVIVLCMCYVYEVFAQQCKEDEHAISGMMLRGHTSGNV